MSHFTHIKTQFQNLFYLKKACEKLNISYKQQEIKVSNKNVSHINLVIPQQNGYDISFCWNGHEYILVADLSLWEGKYSIKKFTDQIGQQYAGNVIIGESQKIGFQPVQYHQNKDGSNTLVLERWSNLAGS